MVDCRDVWGIGNRPTRSKMGGRRPLSVGENETSPQARGNRWLTFGHAEQPSLNLSGDRRVSFAEPFVTRCSVRL